MGYKMGHKIASSKFKEGLKHAPSDANAHFSGRDYGTAWENKRGLPSLQSSCNLGTKQR
jgi:hypothetical protein